MVESKHKYLLEIARSLLYQSKLPSTVIQNKIPFEVLYRKLPTYSHLRSFCCLRFPSTLKTHKDKFEPLSTPQVFIGYPFNTKGYKVLELTTKKIHISRDPLFHENIFPFVLPFPDSTFSSVLRHLNSNTDLLSPTNNILNKTHLDLNEDVMQNSR